MGDFMSLIVKVKVKEYAKGCNVGGDFVAALDDYCTEIVKKACERAQANGRKTVMAKDL